jgi:hypothetical protein
MYLTIQQNISTVKQKISVDNIFSVCHIKSAPEIDPESQRIKGWPFLGGAGQPDRRDMNIGIEILMVMMTVDIAAIAVLIGHCTKKILAAIEELKESK